jgi:hypothetical protein
MRIARVILAFVCCVCLVGLPQSVFAVSVPEVAGTLKIDINITASSSVPSGAVVACQVDVSVGDFGANPSNGDFNEHAGAIATTSTTGGRTCILTIPYAWFLNNAGTAQVGINYHVSILQALAVGSTSQVVEIRRAEHDAVPAFSVPANGAVTTLTFVVRL